VYRTTLSLVRNEKKSLMGVEQGNRELKHLRDSRFITLISILFLLHI